MPPDLLRAEGLDAGYGRVQILRGAGLHVAGQETLVLLGPNGAGKTTLLRALMGLLPLWAGSITFKGNDISALRTDKRVRAGIAFMSEIGCFPGLTIAENLSIGGQFIEAHRLKDRIDSLYTLFPAIASKQKALAGSLSGGQRKMLGIAKALAGFPKLLIMDEPSAGLSPKLVSEVIQTLDQLRGQGLALLIAEQNVKFLRLADRVTILENGRIAFTGSVAEMQHSDVLKKAYFGV